MALLTLGVARPTDACAQGSKADYARASSLAGRTETKVFRQRVQPHWFEGADSHRFWYRVETAAGRHEFVWVDAETGEKRRWFDHEKLAAALKDQGVVDTTPDALPLQQVVFENGRVQFQAGRARWSYESATGSLTRLSETVAAGVLHSPENGPRHSQPAGEEVQLTFVHRGTEEVDLFWLDELGQRHAYGRLRPGTERVQHTFAGHVWLVTDRLGTSLGVYQAATDSNRVEITGDSRRPASTGTDGIPTPAIPGVSPNGKWRAMIRDFQLVVLSGSAGGPGGETEQFRTSDGTRENPYVESVDWAPDSLRLMARRVVPGQEHVVHFVEAAPVDQLQPKLHSHPYLKPGDRLPKPQWVLCDIAAKSTHPIPDTLYPNPFTEDGHLDGHWTSDSQEFRFIYNQRGHQAYRLLAVDGKTGTVRQIIDESSRTFIDWTAKSWHQELAESGEILWMSERDGWCHLYLFDAATGRLKNQITRGEWVVRKVEHVDPNRREIWFYAGGIVPNQDPYQQHLGRVSFDGSGLAVLTAGDGNHQVEFSPDRRWFLDRWSRVDQPPVTELRRARDGQKVCELERADATALLEAGWTLPERVTAKARDGQTDIHGILVRPSNFDPQRRYPVLEEVYAGPQAAYVPKDFGRLLRAHSLAELGFIVVQVDGLGTSQRSKAFHDVCFKNLADAGFPDRIGWIRAAARTRPWMDLSRVGIYGGSAGGQNALRALLDHADFYSAAVADCGCHDNRMDKIWWNEQWLGWPVDESYVRSSNVADAARLRGHLLLVVGEVDRNVDPASTMQVVAALEKADKDFELLVMTGTNHGAAETPYASRRRMDFFVRHLLQREPRWEER